MLSPCCRTRRIGVISRKKIILHSKATFPYPHQHQHTRVEPWSTKKYVTNNIRQGKTRQDNTRHDKTRQDKARQDKTRQDKARQGKTRQDKARQDKARQDKTRQDKTRQDETESYIRCVLRPEHLTNKTYPAFNNPSLQGRTRNSRNRIFGPSGKRVTLSRTSYQSVT